MATLEDKNLTVSREFEFSNDVPSGQVIRQDPKAGKTVKEGTKVTIYVSQGTESIKVTDVRGKSEADAKAALSDFDVTTTTEHSDTVAEGNVISQSISGGQYAEKGASITIVVSSGPEKISYYIKSPVKAPTNVTVTSADISLYKAEKQRSDPVLERYHLLPVYGRGTRHRCSEGNYCDHMALHRFQRHRAKPGTEPGCKL